MGRPYADELAELSATYEWGLSVPAERLLNFCALAQSNPLITIGSGGSLTAAHLAALLHQTAGQVAVATTPLQVSALIPALRSSSVLLLSAGGRNADALAAFKQLALNEPRHLLGVCMKPTSPLADLAKDFWYTDIDAYTIPSRGDGFLAVNSLLAFCLLLVRAYEPLLSAEAQLPTSIASADELRAEVEQSLSTAVTAQTWIVLHGPWGQPVAADLESKFTEAALGHVQVADYRNFAHGRHHWLAKRGDTAVIALVTPDEEDLATRTLRLLPETVPQAVFQAPLTGPAATIHLLLRILHATALVGTQRAIDPGRPGVPEFGRKIYNLRSRMATRTDSRSMPKRVATALLKKLHPPHDKSDQNLHFWADSYKQFTNRLTKAEFGALVLDYDGTLCDPRDRYSGLSEPITNELCRLLQGGLVLGVATGRGKSARIALEKSLPQDLHHSVVIGYYNGADINRLEAVNSPDTSAALNEDLNRIAQALEESPWFAANAMCEARPLQLTVYPKQVTRWADVRRFVSDLALRKQLPIRVLESSHSIDIIPQTVSKTTLVRACSQFCAQRNQPPDVLCIGDRGEWPGNDHDLLSTPYSLSVDSTSPDPHTCWNLAPSGERGAQALLSYLRALRVVDGVARFGTI